MNFEFRKGSMAFEWVCLRTSEPSELIEISIARLHLKQSAKRVCSTSAVVFFSAETLPLYITCHHFSLLNTDGWIASHWMREHAQTIESEVIFSIRKLKLKLNSTEMERDKDHLRLYFYYNLFSGHKNTRFICFLFDFSSSIIILLHYSIMRLLVVFVQNDCVFPV